MCSPFALQALRCGWPFAIPLLSEYVLWRLLSPKGAARLAWRVAEGARPSLLSLSYTFTRTDSPQTGNEKAGTIPI